MDPEFGEDYQCCVVTEASICNSQCAQLPLTLKQSGTAAYQFVTTAPTFIIVIDGFIMS